MEVLCIIHSNLRIHITAMLWCSHLIIFAELLSHNLEPETSQYS